MFLRPFHPPPLLLLLIIPPVHLLFTSPCQLPSSPSHLVPFCQLPYHQVPFICDPGGLLSRTEAELIDRRLRPTLNLTGCLCPSRPCAQQDRRIGQLRAFALIVPDANIEGIRKCTKEKSRSWESFRGERRRRRRKRGAAQGEFASATGQFARMALEKVTGPSGSSRERCDPDLLVLYIDRWTDTEGRQPFIARIFRRNLAHLRDLSQVERVNNAAGPFEVLLEQLGRSLLLANPHISQLTIAPKSSALSAAPSSTSPAPRGFSAHAEPIPFWAAFSALALVILALLALILAHWIGRRISLVNQKKFSTVSRMSTRSTRTEDNGMPSSSFHQGRGTGGSSLRGTVTFGPGTTGGGGGGSASHLKSQMMFRQFSRKTQASVRTVQSQKI